MNKKISTPIAIIVVIILAGLAIGTVLVYQYWWTSEEEIEEETPEDETADWKTYRNEKHGYEIKYPNDWNSPIESGDTDALTGNYSSFFKKGNIFLAFSIDVYENDKNLSLKEWWEQEFYEKFNVKYDYSYEGMVSMSPGIEAAKYKVERAEFEDTCYLFSKNQKVYTIYFSVLSGVEEIEQIVSTFRFIEGDLNHEGSEEIEEPYCVDSDGGAKFYTKGIISSEKETYTDECIGNDNLKEYFCAFNKIGSQEFRCPNSCEDGHCVLKPVINILSPNGGEKWEYGKTYTIEWKSEGINKINIGLEDWEGVIAGDDYKVCTIAKDISASTGKYSWTIKDCPITTGDRFIVRILDVRGLDQGYSQQAESRSDDYFSIME